MNIVYITTVYLPHIGGIEHYVHDLSQYAISKGHSISIIVADGSVKEITQEVYQNEHIYRVPVFNFAGYSFVLKQEVIHKIEIILKSADIVHLNSSKFLYRYLAKKKQSNNYRLYVSSHGWFFHTKKNLFIKELYFKNIVVRYKNYYNGIINVSFQDQMIAEKYGIDRSYVVLSGTDIYKYANLPPKTKYEGKLIYFGRIARNKGIIECIKKLIECQFSYKFTIIGQCDDEGYKSEINYYIEKYNLKERIKLLGELSNDAIRKELEESDVIVMPSLHEGFGLTLVECLLSNRPILANTIDSYKYILKSVSAEEYLFSFNSNASIESKIEELLKKRVKPIDVEQYSIESMARKTFNIYEET